MPFSNLSLKVLVKVQGGRNAKTIQDEAKKSLKAKIPS